MRAHCDILRVRAPIGQAEDGVADREMLVGARALVAGLIGVGKGDDGAGELDAESGGGLGRERVVALALQEVHAVEAEGVDFHQGLGVSGGWGDGGGVGVEGGDGAGVVVDPDGAHCFGDLGGHGGGGGGRRRRGASLGWASGGQ